MLLDSLLHEALGLYDQLNQLVRLKGIQAELLELIHQRLEVRRTTD